MEGLVSDSRLAFGVTGSNASMTTAYENRFQFEL